jgi:hypothetical protein
MSADAEGKVGMKAKRGRVRPALCDDSARVVAADPCWVSLIAILTINEKWD